MAGAVSKPHLPVSHLVGAVSNCAYAVAVANRPLPGPGENIELPIYFLKPHPPAPTVLPLGRHCFQLCRCSAVRKPPLPGNESVYLFLESTMTHVKTECNYGESVEGGARCPAYGF